MAERTQPDPSTVASIPLRSTTSPILVIADALTLAVADATRRMPRRAARLAVALRESAVLAHAGTAAACRESGLIQQRRALEAVDRSLDRLACWFSLAERFGDLSPDAVLRLLEHLTKLRLEILGVGNSLAAPPTAMRRSPRAADITLDVINEPRYGFS